MKKQFLIIICLICVSSLFAQTKMNTLGTPNNKFEIAVLPKLGFARIQETGNVPLTGFVDCGELLLSKGIAKKLNVSTGIGYFNFYGNRTNEGNMSSLKNTYLHIPLNLKANINLYHIKPEDKKVLLALGMGLYGNYLLNQETETVTEESNQKKLGWNFGLSTQIGLKFNVSDILSLGIGFENQGDFTKISHNQVDQKIVTNSIYFSLGFVL